ncbi:MAG: ABC transporter substrate-binding protein [Symbiobacteriaceae bacterium]|nr:MAG: ABC transporter substrate-binding protein [Bacillota bacterium]
MGIVTARFRSHAALAALLAAALLLAACGGGGGTPAGSGEGGGGDGSGGTIKVGLLMPLTGQISQFGKQTSNGAKLAFEQKGYQVGNYKIELVEEDDKNDETEAVQRVQKLITQDQVVAVIGSVSSRISIPISEVLEQAGVVHLTPTSTADNLTPGKKFVFRACFYDSFQGRVMAKFAREHLKANTAAILYDLKNPYSEGLYKSFEAAFKELGGQVVAVESYQTDDQDFHAQLTKIANAKPDVLFIPDYYDPVGLIAQQARQVGVQATMLGADGWDDTQLYELGGEAIIGNYFSNHYSTEQENPESKAFVEAYRQKYGEDPSALAALGYDAANLLMDAIQRVIDSGGDPTDAGQIRDALENTQGFKGVTGTIAFDENHNPVKPAVVLETTKDGHKYVTTVEPE